MSRRRSRSQVIAGAVRRGERLIPALSSRRRLPPALYTLDRPVALRRIGSAKLASASRPDLVQEVMEERRKVRRFPAEQVLSGYSPRARAKVKWNVVNSRESFCHARKVRAEVLFAKQVAGYSGRSPGRRRGGYSRSYRSMFSCGG